MKYKVAYYQDAKVKEKVVDADGFYVSLQQNIKILLFYKTGFGTGKKHTSAFSDFISVEYLEDE